MEVRVDQALGILARSFVDDLAGQDECSERPIFTGPCSDSDRERMDMRLLQ